MKVLQTRIEKDFEQFIKSLTKLESAEFCGVARMLNVDMLKEGNAAEDIKKLRGKRAEAEKVEDAMTEEEKEQFKEAMSEFLRPMEDVMNDMMDKFLGLSKKARKKLLKIMKDCPRGL